jgi:hypothetical protein
MENSSEYQLEPEKRAILLAEIPPVKGKKDKLSVESADEIICSSPNLIGIKAGMPIGELEEILERESKAAYSKYILVNEIDESKQKIQQLKQDLDKEERQLLNLNKQLKNYSLLFFEKPNREYLNQNDLVKRLIKSWILALQVELEASSCSALTKMIDEEANINNERNWRLWLSGTQIPPPKTFEKLMSLKIIKKGIYKGKTLSYVSLSMLTPDIHNLINLLCPIIFDAEAQAAEAAETLKN